MTNINKIIKTIDSCRTREQLKSCINWINDLYNKGLILKPEKYMFLKTIRYHAYF